MYLIFFLFFFTNIHKRNRLHQATLMIGSYTKSKEAIVRARCQICTLHMILRTTIQLEPLKHLLITCYFSSAPASDSRIFNLIGVCIFAVDVTHEISVNLYNSGEKGELMRNKGNFKIDNTMEDKHDSLKTDDSYPENFLMTKME